MSLARVALAFLCAFPLTPAAQAGDEPKDPRPDLEAAQALLDQAVAAVSRPSVHVVLGGREAARGYRLRGFGAVFVLPPRVLPNRERDHDRLLLFGDPPPAAIARRHSRDRELEMRAMQSQAETLQREAEAMQREAERALERFEHNVRVRLVAPPAPEPPAPPEPAVAPSAPSLPPPPPWRFWFENAEPADDRTPERVIADVQAAVTSALEGFGPRLRSLAPDEAIVVAVDFLPSRGFDFDAPPTPARSLIVKARKRDLVDRGEGKIDAKELRRRIEVTQY